MHGFRTAPFESTYMDVIVCLMHGHAALLWDVLRGCIASKDVTMLLMILLQSATLKMILPCLLMECLHLLLM